MALADPGDVTLRVKLYDIASNFVTDLDNVTGRKLTMTLNDVDQFEFTAYLDDPQAAKINPIGEKVRTMNPSCVVKVWRDVKGLDGYDPQPNNLPTFCGFVGSRVRNANANTATFTVYSPFWHLQHRFHVDIHDFTVATGMGVHYEVPAQGDGRDPSEIMALMIGFTAHIDFGADTAPFTGTGIEWGHFTTTVGPPKGVDPGPCRWANYEPILGIPLLVEKRYERGQNTWELISDIISAPGMPDLKPHYFHVTGEKKMLRFDTMISRGVQRDFSLDYGIGPDSNLEDIGEQLITDPGSFATHIAVQGQGDRQVDKTNEIADGTHRAYPYSPGQFWPPSAVSNDPDNDYNSVSRYGLWQRWEKMQNATDQRERRGRAIWLLSRSLWAPTVLTPTLSPVFVYRYPVDFDVGDTVRVNIDRHSMKIGSPNGETVRKRISVISLSYSDNDMETVGLELIDDYEEVVHAA